MIPGAGRRASRALFGTSIHAADVHCISSAPAIAGTAKRQPSAPSAARERRLIASPSRLRRHGAVAGGLDGGDRELSLSKRCWRSPSWLRRKPHRQLPGLPATRPTSSWRRASGALPSPCPPSARRSWSTSRAVRLDRDTGLRERGELGRLDGGRELRGLRSGADRAASVRVRRRGRLRRGFRLASGVGVAAGEMVRVL